MNILKGQKVQISFNFKNQNIKGLVKSTSKKGIFLTVLSKEYVGSLDVPQDIFIPINSIHFIQIEGE